MEDFEKFKQEQEARFRLLMSLFLRQQHHLRIIQEGVEGLGTLAGALKDGQPLHLFVRSELQRETDQMLKSLADIDPEQASELAKIFGKWDGKSYGQNP